MKKLVFATNNGHKLAEVRAILAGSGIELLSLEEIGCHDDIPETAETLEGNALQKARWVHDRYGVDCFADDTGLEVDALDGAPGVHTARFAGPGHDNNANVDLLLEKMQGVGEREDGTRGGTAGNGGCCEGDGDGNDGEDGTRGGTAGNGGCSGGDGDGDGDGDDGDCNGNDGDCDDNDGDSNGGEGLKGREAAFRTVVALIMNGVEHCFEGRVDGWITHTRRGEGGFGYDPVFAPAGYDGRTFAELGTDVKNRISHRARAVERLNTFLRTNA